MPITPEQSYLSLPTGLTEQDYTFAGQEGNLLDYTPPDVQWQTPYIPAGENVFQSYAQRQPDLLKTYNIGLSLPEGQVTTVDGKTVGPLPQVGGRPESLAEYGLRHWQDYGQAEGRDLYDVGGESAWQTGWYDPNRSPFIAYGGGGVAGGAGQPTAGGVRSQPFREGFEYAYPVWGWQEDDMGGTYQPGVWDGTRSPDWDYYTQNIEEFPYFPYTPGHFGTKIDDSPYISVGQSLLPAGDYPSDRSGWGDVFRYTGGKWY